MAPRHASQGPTATLSIPARVGAWASSVVFVDAVFTSCRKELSAKGGATVMIVGAQSRLVIGGKTFRTLKGAIRDARISDLPDGGQVVELTLIGSTSASDSDAGTLLFSFPREAGLDPEQLWSFKQFLSDLEMTFGRAVAIVASPQGRKRCAPETSELIDDRRAPSWIGSVRFSGGIQVERAHPHPEQMLEHDTLSGVDLPELGALELALPPNLVTEGFLSEPQLQAVCYAVRSFQRGGGFLLGDGTGCGKGRVIAALLVHTARKPFDGSAAERAAEIARRKIQGKSHRCLWVSSSRDLAKDAERDLNDLGAEEAGLRLCQSVSSNGENAGNIMFVTYAKLRNPDCAGSIANWLGAEAARGLLIFDEAHCAKNFVHAKEGGSSMQGRMVDYLQRACPKASVLYASATACTEVSQMAYMSRLGLWGPGGLYEDFQSFQRAVELKGFGGMEEVARQLKSRGSAACRSLSHAGTHLGVCVASLDADRAEIYDRACEFWSRLRTEAAKSIEEIVHDDQHEHSAAVRLEHRESEYSWHESDEDNTHITQVPFRRFWSTFWACQLRFFRSLVVSLKVSELKRRAEAALADGDQVVVTLWSTGEAQLHSANGFDKGEGFGSAEIMLDQLLLQHFPCPPDGHVRSLVLSAEIVAATLGKNPKELSECATEELDPIVVKVLHDMARSTWSLLASVPLTLVGLRRTSDGSSWCADFHGATSPEVRRAALRAELRTLQLPQHPMDELLDVLGGPSQVAELSGRGQRLVRGVQKQWEVEPRQGGENVRELEAFQSGSKRIAIITEAASTGISLHSDRRRLKVGFLPRRRTMLLAELGYSADKTLQQLGRVHRSNQQFPPRFEVVLSGVPGEAKVATALSRRLKCLGAVTRGDQHSACLLGNGGLDQVLSTVDLVGKRADVGIKRMAEHFRAVSGDTCSDKELAAAFARLDLDHCLSISRYLGRSLMLPIRLQQAMFERLQSYIAEPEPVSDQYGKAMNSHTLTEDTQLLSHRCNQASTIRNANDGTSAGGGGLAKKMPASTEPSNHVHSLAKDKDAVARSNEAGMRLLKRSRKRPLSPSVAGAATIGMARV